MNLCDSTERTGILGVGLVAILLSSWACPAFDPEFGEIGIPEIRTLRDQAAQRGAIIELRLGQLLGPVMRSHDIGCWVIVWQRQNADPLLPVLTSMRAGSAGRAALLLCEGETGGSTRVALGSGMTGDSGVYELIDVADDEALAHALVERIEMVNPRNIAVNRSPERPLADGLSASNEAWLQAALGPNLAPRFVPSGPLVEEWLSQHLDVEVPLFTEAARLTVGLLEEVLSDEYIVAAGTSLTDLTWATRQHARDMGLTLAVPPVAYLQRSGSAAQNAGLAGVDILIQTGDLVFLTVGIEYLGYVTHYGRWLYMLHEEEDQAPEWVLSALSETADDLEAALPHLQSGRTADQIAGSLAVDGGGDGAGTMALGRVGFLVDRGLVTASAARTVPLEWLWRSEPALQPGGMVAVAVSQWRAESTWQEAGVWITLLENAVVGPAGARLVVPPQRVPYLID
jgi:hypothetical protein